jgi:hypothetical protein
MLIIPTRGRPHNLQRLVEACEEFGMPDCGLTVVVDADDPYSGEYEEIKFPGAFIVRGNTSRKGAVEALNYVFQMYPEKDWYAMIGDDVLPRTKDWWKILAEAAGNGGIAWGRDGIQDVRLATHPFVGGELVRAMGNVLHPEFYHFYADQYLHMIGERLGLLRYRDDVFLEHMHPVAGKATTHGYHNQDIMDLDHITYARLVHPINFNRELARIHAEIKNA